MSIAALCLLATACSEDNNEPTDATTRSLTIGCGIGKTTPGTRASVTPGNPNKLEENFIWHEGDAFDGWLIPQGQSSYLPTSSTFAIDEKYSDNTPSKSASFTCPDFPTGSASYKMLATYPNYYYTKTGDEFTYSLSRPPQIGSNNTSHLSKDMAMYATTTVTSANSIPAMTFHHLSALLRFTVTNKNTSACRIKQISIVCEGRVSEVFGVKYSLKVDDWEKGTITHSCTKGTTSLVLATQNSATDNGGIELSAAGDTDKHDAFDAYVMTGPGTAELPGQNLIFQIIATDTDGTSNERAYTSLVLNGDKIHAEGSTTWEPGKRYWFNLVLDDALTVTLNGVTDMPGWGTDNEL